MKSIHKLLFILAFFFAINSCSKEVLSPENDISCGLDYQSHTHALPLQALVDQYAVEGFVGMTLLVDDPKDGLWMGSAGYASIEKGIQMNPCQIHHTASLYKTFIATVIMQLVAENKISLDDPLTKYLSANITDQLPNGNSISIRNLLQQRTGIPDIFEVDFITNFFNQPTKGYTIEELLEYVYNKDPLSEVDTKFHYSDANFSLLTLVVEQVEGDYIEAIKNRIFTTLDLKDTYFLEDINQTPVGLVDSYWDRYGDGHIENNSEIQISLTTGLRGSDGIVTSADDLKIFMQALAKGELVSSISEMTDFLEVPSEVQETQVYSGYGMGLMKVKISGEEWYGHFGNQIGSGAIVLYNPYQEMTMVAFQNTGTFFSDSIKSKFFYQLLSDLEAIVF